MGSFELMGASLAERHQELLTALERVQEEMKCWLSL